jgi:EmrB/QacA subfamily drug resistance transporter
MFYLFTAYFLSIMNLTSIKILLPEIMTDLGVELNWLTWVVNSYTLPVAALIPIAGRIGDIYGPRRFFLAGIFILGLGSLLCGTAFSLGWLIAGRIVQALGAAMLVPNSLAILLSKAGVSERGRRLGTWAGIGASGAVIGPVVSGLLADIVSWRGSFLIIAALSVVLTFAAGRQMVIDRELGTWVKKAKRRFDGLGALILMSATAILLLGITLFPDWGWQNNWVRLSLILFIALIFLFYRVEKAAEDPLLSPVLIRNPSFNLGLLVGFIEQLVVSGTLFVMPIFFSTVQGHGPAVTAILLTPAAISVTLFSTLGGRLSDRFGPGKPITAGMFLRMISFIMLSQITPQTGYPYIAAGLALNGLGFALTATPALHSVLSTVDSEQHGITSGVHNMVRFTGAAAGTTIGGIILYALIPVSIAGVAGPIPGFRETYLFGAAICLPGIAAGVYLAYLKKAGTKKVKTADLINADK